MSTSAQAVAEATRLQTIMRGYGVECRFQLRQGASGSGWMTPLSQRVGEMSHHVASRPSQGLTPFYNLVRNGRAAGPGAPAVPGPLANGYMGFDGIYRIITLGWANHPGAGGPITLPKGTVPRDNGRPRFWGTEYEGGFEDWSAFMHDKMARANAAILDWLGLTTAAHIEHSTWAPSRKIDRRGYTAASGRNRITAVRGTTGGGGGSPPPAPTTKEFYDMFKDKAELAAFIRLHARGGVWNDHEFNTVPVHGIPAETAGMRLRRIAILAAQTSGGRFTDIWRSARKAERLLPGRSGVGNNGELWPRVARLLDLPEQSATGDVDVAALAEELAAVLTPLPDDLAEQVVTALSNRLKENS